MDLASLGWNRGFQVEFEELKRANSFPARVSIVSRDRYTLISEREEMIAELPGAFRHKASSLADFPAVGDWVAVERETKDHTALIYAVLPRRSSFSRKAVLGGEKTDEQVLAANIDTVFITVGLDENYSINRIERYLAIAYDSGAMPVIILNKRDVAEDPDSLVDEVEQVAYGVPVHAVSARENHGIDGILSHFETGKTGVFLGSSGVGKSSLINRILGEERLTTTDVRASDSRGRHTTTHRELIVLPQGGIVIDTPGLRGIAAFEDRGGIERAFGEIDSLAESCKFNDCSHTNEPGCAVMEALENGELDQRRYENYFKLLREKRYQSLRADVAARRRQEREWNKKIREGMKRLKRSNPKYDR